MKGRGVLVSRAAGASSRGLRERRRGGHEIDAPALASGATLAE
ncbi:hypothetical protein ABZ802_32865 [Streptomyces sp. NPDC047737]